MRFTRCAAIVAAIVVVLAGIAHAQSPPKPAPPKVSSGKAKELVAKWFAADAAGRVKLEQELAPIDRLTPEDAKKWLPLLVELARKSDKGAKLAATGTNWLIDEKEKIGKYIVGGDKKAKQLIICMHGGGAGSGDAESAVGGFGGALSKLKSTVIVYPEVLQKTEHGWTGSDTERFVLDLIEAAKRTHPIDVNRVYLTGHSMGGFGTWTLGSRHADLFGGLAAFAGAPTPYLDPKDDKKAVGIEDGVLPCLYNLPLFLYQSGDDKNVPAFTNDFAGAELDRLAKSCDQKGWKHVYERVEGRGHDFPADGPAPGVEWALSHVRDPRPKKILWQPSRTWKKDFYWLHSEQPALGTTITAEVTAPNQVTITTEGTKLPKGLALWVDDRLFDLTQRITVTVDGVMKWNDPPVLSLKTMLETLVARSDPDYVFPARLDL